MNLEDAVLENRRFAADRIRNALKNTCVWHPQNNWLATTSDGPDALIWMLPLQNEIKNEKKIPNDSKHVNLSDSLRKQNRRVALDHSNDPVFQIAWNVRKVFHNFSLLLTYLFNIWVAKWDPSSHRIGERSYTVLVYRM